MANLLASSHTSPVSASYFTLGNCLFFPLPASWTNLCEYEKELYVTSAVEQLQSVLWKITAHALFWRLAACHASATALPISSYLSGLKSASGKQILLLNLGLHLEVAVEWLGFKIASTDLLPGSIWIPYLRAFSGELQQVINFHQHTGSS